MPTYAQNMILRLKVLTKPDIKLAKEFYEYSKKYSGKIVELPVIIESDTMEGKVEGQHRKVDITEIKARRQF
jgi:phosphoglycerate kinase